MTSLQRGRLADPSTAPAVGEHNHELVLSGGAVLEVGGDPIELVAQDWIFLPAGTPHRVLRTEPGTNWITVKLAPATR